MARGGFNPMGGGNIQQLMKQAQKMQQDMIKMQEELDTMTCEASTGGGMVTVKVKGTHEVLSVEIDPEALESKEDIEMIEDTLVTLNINGKDYDK